MTSWKVKIIRSSWGIALAIPAVYVAKEALGFFSKVQGVSMQDTINPKNEQDIIFISRFNLFNGYNGFNIKHGDVVCFLSPVNPDKTLIKRVVGLDGDTVRAVNYNKKRIKSEYVKIPPGHCWVEGDNSKHSLDSNDFGPVPVGFLTGKATHVVWPPSHWRRLQPVEVGADRVQKSKAPPQMQVQKDAKLFDVQR